MTGTSPQNSENTEAEFAAANPKDAEGRLMRPMARSLANEDAIRNVVAYVGTLKP